MVYVFLADGFEDIEALAPIDILRRANVDVKTVSVTGKEVTSSHGVTVKADISVSDIKLDSDLELIVLPGGMPGTLNLEANAGVQKAIDFCAANDKYIAAICAAPSILGHKGILSGKNAVCYEGFEAQLEGAKIGSGAVAVDGNIITGEGPGATLPYAYQILSFFVGDDVVKAMKDKMQYTHLMECKPL